MLGGSYGGFMTSWIVGHTDRFKAACSERAVNDQRTMFGTSDIGHAFNAVAVGGAMPWEASGAIRRALAPHLCAAHHHAAAHHALGGGLRCPIEQAEQLFVALKKLGREVLFVRFPGENHELSRSGTPRHRLERFRIILDWFGRYLK